MSPHITIPNTQGHTLHGILQRGRRPGLLILCHGYRGSKDDYGVRRLARALTARGWSVFRFDFTGHGASHGTPSLQQQVKDIGSVLEHFRRYERRILVGISLAAISTTIAANKHPTIAGLITVNGAFTPRYLSIDRQLLLLAHCVQPRGMADLRYFRTHFAPQAVHVPTLLIHGTADTRVKPEQALSVHQQLQCNKALAFIPNANHSLDRHGNIHACAQTITQWLTGPQRTRPPKQQRATSGGPPC